MIFIYTTRPASLESEEESMFRAYFGGERTKAQRQLHYYSTVTLYSTCAHYWTCDAGVREGAYYSKWEKRDSETVLNELILNYYSTKCSITELIGKQVHYFSTGSTPPPRSASPDLEGG